MIAMLAGISSATPPDVVRVDEEFFGAGDGSYAVMRTVSDNKGSYYINRTTTTLVERSLDGASASKETPLLDREEIVDATYEGPGKAPVKVVIHSKNEKDALATFIEKWPQRGREVAAEELKRFTLHDGGLKYDGRLELLAGTPPMEELNDEGRKASGWIIKDGIELGDCLFFKLSYQEEEGDSLSRWVSLGNGSMDQVTAFRTVQPVYLSFGSFASKDEALKRSAELKAGLKEKQLSGHDPAIWRMTAGNGAAAFVVVVADSRHLIESGKIPEVEAKLGVKLLPVSSSGFTAWVREGE